MDHVLVDQDWFWLYQVTELYCIGIFLLSGYSGQVKSKTWDKVATSGLGLAEGQQKTLYKTQYYT